MALYLRGGADALSLVAPYADPDYLAARPKLKVSAASAIDLDGFFGFHPSLAPLHPWFQAGRLAVVHACGSPSGTRSHFDAQDFMEYATPDDKTIRVGWLNRFLVEAGLTAPISAVTMENQVAKMLAGPVTTLSLPALVRMEAQGTYATERRAALRAIYAASDRALLQTMGGNAMDLLDLVETVDTSTSVVYPASKLGGALKDLAALIKADVGVRVAAVNHGSWDHHANETIQLPLMADDLGSSLAAFAADLGPDLDRTVVLVMSEFGRRLVENGALGCDHGHGGIMLALGGAVQGGQVMLRDDTWPGLQPEQLFTSIDLQATTDFRDIFAEVLERHMGLNDPSPVFPSYSVDPSSYIGLFA